MSKEIPFNDDVMTLIMGLGGPEKPGQHGRTTMPEPDGDTVEFITSIRDMCEEFLRKFGKSTGEEKPKSDSKDLVDEADTEDEEKE